MTVSPGCGKAAVITDTSMLALPMTRTYADLPSVFDMAVPDSSDRPRQDADRRDVKHEHRGKRTSRGRRCAGKFSPHENTPQRGYQRCALADRVGDGKPDRTACDEIRRSPDGPNGAAQ